MSTFRYLKVLIAANGGNEFLSVQELQVRETVGGPNILTSASPTTQSSYHLPDNGTAARLVDGNLTDITNAWTAHWANGVTSYPQWFAVDLGAERSVAEIAMLRNPNTWADGRMPRDFQVLGSNTDLDATDHVVVKAFTNVTDYVTGTFRVLDVSSSVVVPPNANNAPPVLVSAEAKEGDNIILTFNQNISSTFTPAGSTFTLNGYTVSNVLISGKTVTLTGIAPFLTYGQTIPNLSYAKPATGGLQNSGNYEVASFTTPVTNSIRNIPVVPGYIVKTFGAAAGNDFLTREAFKAYLDANGGLDVPAGGKPVVVFCYDPLVLTGFYNFGPKVINDTMYVTVKPAPGLGYSDIEADNAPSQINNTGLALTISDSTCRMGIVFDGFRVLHSGNTANWRGDGWGQSGTIGGFRNCRLDITTGSQPFNTGEYNTSVIFDDCLVVHNHATYAGSLVAGKGKARRSTFARIGNTANDTPIVSGNASGDGFDEILDCLFSNMGGNPNRNASGSNNYSNKPLAAGAANLTHVSGNFFTSASDYRPAAGSPMIGGGSLSSVSTIDNHGNNRGFNPDAGSTQLNFAPPLIKAAVTQQSAVDGESISFSGTYEGVPTSAVGSILPANPANGAQSQGPTNLTLVQTGNTGTWSISYDNIVSGNYVPVFTFTNDGGVVQATGSMPFEVMGVDSSAEDSNNAATPATGFAWNPPTSGTTNVASAPFSVSADGALTGLVRFTPSDGGAGGTFTPAFLDLSSSTPTGTMTYMRPTAGTSTLTATNTGSLANPSPVTYTATTSGEPTPPAAPTISISTATNDIMSGRTATISGLVNLQGDVSGRVDVFIDPQPSGTPVALGSAPINNGVFTRQATLSAGQYRLRAVATANGQTASATTATLRVLGASGTVRIPVA